jgi:hypothetical protein
MSTLKWIDLFKFLNEKANDVRNVGTFDWQAPVVIYDANTGDESYCDTYYLTGDNSEDRFVLMSNIERPTVNGSRN